GPIPQQRPTTGMHRRSGTCIAAGSKKRQFYSGNVVGRGQASVTKSFFYASLGPALTHYGIEVEDARLARQGTVMLPAKVQYAWPHPTAPFLYVATSNGGASSLGVRGDKHYLSALRIDSYSGDLKEQGAAAALKSRPIHVTVDHTGRFALVAYNDP